MTLKDYLRKEKVSPREFADRVGHTIHAVRKWANGQRTPRPSAIGAIMRASKGKVAMKDWKAFS